MMFFLQERRKRSLLNETLGRATTEIDDARDACLGHYIHHVEYVLDDVEEEVVLLFKSSAGDADRQATVGDCWTEDRNASFVCGCEDAVFGCDLGQFAPEQVEKFSS